MLQPFVSICIPSYNRPRELQRLLNSVNIGCSGDMEILICEDKSPKRDEIVAVVEAFAQSSPLETVLHLNEANLGYDGNLRNLVAKANGEYIIFMGDDDVFDTPNLPAFIGFLKEHTDLGYILKTHTFIHQNGERELFKYFPDTKFFEPGPEAYQTLFRKSVFISGFCIKRAAALPYQTHRFDGGLLYQLYLLAEVTLKYPSAFCAIPLTIQDERLRGVPMFGSSEREKNLYKPGEITVENSLNFMKGFFDITGYIDQVHGLQSSVFMKKNFSKYAYPVLSVQRNKGRKIFRKYCKQLENSIQINQTIYYYVYYYGLLAFGKRFCDQAIVKMKKILGSTPNL
ncbi:MAG: glycosyltransferase family 2 protein [Edaphocola sp.]